MKLIAHVSVCSPYSNSWTRRVSSSSQQPLLSRISSAALLLLLACVFVPVASQAQVTITVPGPTSPSIQITGAVPMRVVVNSGNSFAVDHVQVLDGTTQIAIYTGNGTTSFLPIVANEGLTPEQSAVRLTLRRLRYARLIRSWVVYCYGSGSQRNALPDPGLLFLGLQKILCSAPTVISLYCDSR